MSATEPKQTAPESDVANLLPPELKATGWRLHQAGEKWRAKNQTLGLFSSACDYPGDAIEAARKLAAGQKSILDGRLGTITFTDPDPPGSAGEMIRCPECGIADELEPKFVDNKLVSFTCPRGHEFNGNESKSKPAGKKKTPAPEIPKDAFAFYVELKYLDASTTNARQIFDEVKLAELAASVADRGILEPLIVRPGKKPGRYEIVAGERRFRAAKIAKLPLVPIILRNLTDAEAEEIQTIENDQREDLNAFERGAGYIKLIERHGHTPETLAAAVQKSKTFIYDQIKLARLPERAQKALLEGTIPQSTATLIARIPSEKRREAAAEEIVGAKPYPSATYTNDQLSFRQAKSLIERNFCTQLKGAPFNRDDATLVPAAGACSTCPKLTGNNRIEFPEGRADVCTDPQCFNQKIAAHDARTRTKAKENEIKVLSASETKKLFSYGELNHYNAGAAYLDLAEQCNLDKQKKKRSYKQLLGDAVAPVLAINPQSHRAHYLVTRKEAAPILLKTHNIKISVPSPSASGSKAKKDPQSEAKRQLEQNVFELAVQLAGEEIALQAEVAGAVISRSPGASEYMKPVALLMFENSLNIGDGDAEERIAIRFGLISPPKEKSKATKKHLSRNVTAWKALQKLVEKGSPSSSAEQIFGAALQMEFVADSYGHKLDDRQQRILKMFPRVGAFESYLVRAREQLTKPPEAAPAKTKAAAGGRGK